MDTKRNIIVVFDLDDTLYKEIDFLKSAFNDIAIYLSSRTTKAPNLILEKMMDYYKKDTNVFEAIILEYHIKDVTIQDLLLKYRNHKPKITLLESAQKTLTLIKKEVYKVGLITDGRRVQQRHKIEALGLSDYFDDIIISEEFGTEKPDINNFKHFSEKYGNTYNYVYIGDNIKKDFMAPNRLGWNTICLLDNGKNIHNQSLDIELIAKPFYFITDLSEIENILLKTNKTA